MSIKLFLVMTHSYLIISPVTWIFCEKFSRNGCKA